MVNDNHISIRLPAKFIPHQSIIIYDIVNIGAVKVILKKDLKPCKDVTFYINTGTAVIDCGFNNYSIISDTLELIWLIRANRESSKLIDKAIDCMLQDLNNI